MMGTKLRRGSWLGVVEISRRLLEGFTPYMRISMRVDDTDMTHEPAPARALDAGSGSVEFLLEVVEAAKGLVDGILERARLELAACTCSRGEVLPKEGVVDVT